MGKLFTIEEAFRQLNSETAYAKSSLSEDKLSYKSLYDFYDQVYCSLTHGEDRGADIKILGDLGRIVHKYPDENISTGFSPDGTPRIIVTDSPSRIGNAIAVAEIYGLQYSVKNYRGTTSVIIDVPDNLPVNRDLLNYRDTEHRLKDIQLSSLDRLLIDLKNGAIALTDISRASKQLLRKYAQELRQKIENKEITMRDLSSLDNEILRMFSDDENADKKPLTAGLHRAIQKHAITETVESSMPTTPLSEVDIHSFVDAIPIATGTRPPQPFKLGYIRELKSEIAAKYRGGRGSADQTQVRIFKASEYSRLYTKAAYENTASAKAYRQQTGKAPSHDVTGFHYTDTESGNILNAIGTYPNGDLALQAYVRVDNRIKVAYYLSINGGDLQRVNKEDILMYLTPGTVSKLQNTQSEDELPRTPKRFKLSGIYMLGNLGHSII